VITQKISPTEIVVEMTITPENTQKTVATDPGLLPAGVYPRENGGGNDTKYWKWK